MNVLITTKNRRASLQCITITGVLLTVISGFSSVAYTATIHVGLDQERMQAFGVDNQLSPGLGLHYVIRENQRSVWFAEIGSYRDSGRHIAKLALLGY